jgi:cystathionine gamma-synthase
LIQYAESLSGIETLLTYPTEQIQADVAIEQWKLGITEKLLRLSVGVDRDAEKLHSMIFVT